MKAAIVVGLLLTLAVAALLWVVAGQHTLFAAVTFGLLATAVNAAAIAALKPAIHGSFRQLAGRWAVGMGLRLFGAALWLTAVLVDRVMFPPLPSALGYLGVLIPLLFAEMRFVR